MTKGQAKNLLKRQFKRNQRELTVISNNVGRRFDIHIVDKFSRFKAVRRPVLTWLALVFVLILAIFIQVRQVRGYYLAELPVPGGTLKVGMVGSISNINPLYAGNDAEAALSELVFSSLVKLDGRGSIVGDLAREWSINPEGTVYTFKLRENAHFHDGQVLDADDIVFTFQRLQHPDSRSPIASSWQGVQVAKDDDRTVSFTLPTAFAPFLYSLCDIGILPQHLLEGISPDQLRGNSFNLAAPVGSGPFVFIDSSVVGGTEDIETATIRVRLQQFRQYHLGKPQLDNLQIYIYSDRDRMIADYNDGGLALVEGLEPSDLSQNILPLNEDITAETLPDEEEHLMLNATHSTVEAIPLTSVVMLFFNTDDSLLKDGSLRQALSYAIDRKQIVSLANSYYYEARGPLLPMHLGYNSGSQQPLPDLSKAATLLDQIGWTLAEDGWRYKDGIKLELTILTQSSGLYPEVLANIQQQLKTIGVSVVAKALSGESLQPNHILPHSYQALLFGVNVSFDPDVYAYWHSSQAKYAGLNLSNYRSSVVDTALEGGRTRIDEQLRIAKYHTFQSQWLNDTPAIALYRPSYIIAYKPRVKGIDMAMISSTAEIYSNVYKWTVNIGPAQIPY